MRGRKWLWSGLAGTAALLGGLGSVPAPAAPPGAVAGSQAAAVVNGEVVSMAELESFLKKGEGGQPAGDSLERRQEQMHALFMIVDQRLMKQFLAKNGKPINPAEVDKKMADLQQALQKNGKTLADFCRDANQTEAQLREVLALNLQWYAWTADKVKEEDLQKHYQEYKDYFDGVTIRVSHIMLRVPYNSSPGDREQTRVRLREIRAQILAGKMDFAAAAKQYSHCQLSTGKGGDLGYVPRKGPLEESLARVAFSLKPGQISEPVDSEFGVHLLQVTDRKSPPQQLTYAQIKPAVHEDYIADIWHRVLDEQRKAAKIEWRLPGMVNTPTK